jgi:hypothetical protein
MLEIHGGIDIIKGALTEEISFYAKVGDSMYPGLIILEDWEINDVLGAEFNGMPIDDLCQLKSTLKESGLTTLANTLNMDSAESRKQICKQLLKDDMIKKVFGENQNFIELLSKTEKDIVHLTYAIKNYKNISENAYQLKNFCELDEDGRRIKPELKVLKAALKKLKATK